MLTCASSETALGLAGLLAAASLAAVNPGGGIATGLAIGLAVQAITYLTAPLVALAADRSLARAAGNLLEIPAVAIAPTSTSQPIQSRAACAAPAHTPGHCNGREIPPSAAALPWASILRIGHWTKVLQKFVTTGTPGGPPSDGDPRRYADR